MQQGNIKRWITLIGITILRETGQVYTDYFQHFFRM